MPANDGPNCFEFFASFYKTVLRLSDIVNEPLITKTVKKFTSSAASFRNHQIEGDIFAVVKYTDFEDDKIGLAAKFDAYDWLNFARTFV